MAYNMRNAKIRGFHAGCHCSGRGDSGGSVRGDPSIGRWRFRPRRLVRVVYAAVLLHLKPYNAPQSCFLSKASRDFEDPDLVNELSTYNCKLLSQFDAGYQFMLSRLP
jgi:hypothetical protein